MGTISRQTEGLQLFSVIKGGGKNKPTLLVKVSRIFLYFKCRHKLYGILFFLSTVARPPVLLCCWSVALGKRPQGAAVFLDLHFSCFLCFCFCIFVYCCCIFHVSVVFCFCNLCCCVVFTVLFCNQSFNHCIAHPLLNTHIALLFRCKWCDSGCWRYLLNIWCLILLMPTCQCWQCW